MQDADALQRFANGMQNMDEALAAAGLAPWAGSGLTVCQWGGITCAARQQPRGQHLPAGLRAARCGSGCRNSCMASPPSVLWSASRYTVRACCNALLFYQIMAAMAEHGAAVKDFARVLTRRHDRVYRVERCRPRVAVAPGKPTVSKAARFQGFSAAAVCREPERRAGGAVGAARAQHGEQPADGHAAARVRRQPAQPAGARPVRQPAPGAAPVLAPSPPGNLRRHAAQSRHAAQRTSWCLLMRKEVI